ncbi:hypothetical protein TNIN_90161 [Trichonephila inaurata madagascariensis]|uniref:Uncharacterized protein n=1 Tax=Trichonephila inaurata madagascariensis TaxID=2747483 RepID=A0A8X7CNH5_9ARAC|nr:hypothetical protein TNIN_90161 [Trichonephila inaurata madagascariensis]
MILHGDKLLFILNPKYYRKKIQVSPKSIKSLPEPGHSYKVDKTQSSSNVCNDTIKPYKRLMSPETKIQSKDPILNKNIIQIVKRGIPHINEQLFKNTISIRQNILSDPSIEIKENLVSSSFETEESTMSHSYPKANKKKCKHAALLRKETSSTQLLNVQNFSTDYGTLHKEITPRKKTPKFQF